MNPLDKLIEGFKNFRQQYYIAKPELYKKLVGRGQTPKTLVVACCDSRVHPDQIFDTSPGDIFVIRNVANLVPPFEDDGKSHSTSAAIEYGVKHLEVKNIIVFGHRQCGGIKTLMEGGMNSEDDIFIDPWMNIMLPSRNKILESHPEKSFAEQCQMCEQAAVGVSVNNLLSFPWINSRVDAGELEVHGWYFEIEKGVLLKLQQEDGSFSSMHL